MRKAFIETLIGVAARDPPIVLLTGDLGFMVIEAFQAKFPSRFFNVGVAEQNMVGIATGLAEAGFIPFVYSINTFAALRPYEFIRNGPVLHGLPVRIVAVGGGFEYGPAGPTHHGLEDIAVMRAQPGLHVVAPADAAQTRSALLHTWELPGPVYYRLGKNDQARVDGLGGRFALDEVQVVREGNDLILVAMGAIAREAVAAAEMLSAQGVDAAVAVVAHLNPPPIDALTALLRGYRTAVTVEAHTIHGGVGSLVSEVIAEAGIACQVMRCGVRAQTHGVTGSEAYLNALHGLDAASLAEAVRHMMTETR